MLWLADTSVAVPALLASHLAHVQVQDQLAGRVLGLTAHAALETYSVLTRLPGDARLSLDDASTLIAERFDSIIAFEPDQAGTNLVAQGNRRWSSLRRAHWAHCPASRRHTAHQGFTGPGHVPRNRSSPRGPELRSLSE